MKNLYILFIVLSTISLLNISCSNKSKEQGSCKASYENVVSLINEYYMENNKEAVHKSLKIINTSIKDCEDKNSFILLKLNVLIILQKYRDGYLFVDSLDPDVFGLPYQKKMFFNYFKAKTFEDSTIREDYFKEVVLEIEKYLNDYPKNKEAILDLFGVKSQYLQREQILMEIDKMSESSDDTVFYEGLKNSYEQVFGDYAQKDNG